MDSNGHILGIYEGELPGPLMVCIGGMHGNEPAGVNAIHLLLKMLEVEPITNPSFTYKGIFAGLLGNPEAFRMNVRFVDKDMNRSWSARSTNGHPTTVTEEVAIQNIIKIIKDLVDRYAPTEVVFIDLHTTSSTGGIFSIVTDDPNSQRLAQEIYAPVIKGFLQELGGTSLHYISRVNIDIPVTGIAFEAGNHAEALSVNRAIAAVICSMRAAGCVTAGHVESRHVEILKEYSKDLPGMTRLIYRHNVDEDDGFEMLPDFQNFQPVSEGQVLASDKNGPIKSPSNGLILLPLYQEQGNDGFFIVQPIHE